MCGDLADELQRFLESFLLGSHNLIAPLDRAVRESRKQKNDSYGAIKDAVTLAERVEALQRKDAVDSVTWQGSVDALEAARAHCNLQQAKAVSMMKVGILLL